MIREAELRIYGHSAGSDARRWGHTAEIRADRSLHGEPVPADQEGEPDDHQLEASGFAGGRPRVQNVGRGMPK